MSSRRTRSARPPGLDWEDSYFALEERHRQLQQRFTAQEAELKRRRVAERRAAARHSVPYPTSAPSSSTPHKGVSFAKDTAHVPVRPTVRNDDAHAAARSELSMWSPAVSLPDPAMIWSSEDGVRNYVAASALYHANEELRQKLEHGTTLQHSLHLELAASRTAHQHAQTRVDELAQQLRQAVRERDAATQQMSGLQQTNRDLETALQRQSDDAAAARFSLENQLNELRGRLVLGADRNEQLSRDVCALQVEARDRANEAAALRSRLTLTESALSAQKTTNANLLVELQNLNAQLGDARRRVVTALRETHHAELERRRTAEAESQRGRLADERDALERAYVQLLGEFVRVTDTALAQARRDTEQDLAQLRAHATHWEEVAQLLYKDVAERTDAHRRCRDECEAAKAQRDQLALELRACRAACEVAHAKLDVAWPSHAMDASDLTAREIAETFRRPHAVFDPATRLATCDTGANTTHQDEPSLPPDFTTRDEKLSELREANASLFAQLAQVQMSNELLQERIAALTRRQTQQDAAQASALQACTEREVAGRQLLARELDRVSFLEAQVRSLRGYRVSPDTALDHTDPNELILELFLGQLVATQAAGSLYTAPEFASVFCSVDFLLHDTVTTRTITGLNGFFDTTVSFCISMDALLLYYLQTRALLLQLHRVRSADELGEVAHRVDSDTAHDESTVQTGDATESVIAERMFATVAEGRVSLADLVEDEHCRNAARPQLRGHVKLYTPDGHHIASVEFQLTARAPFTPAFRALAAQTCPRDDPPAQTDASLTERVHETVGLRVVPDQSDPVAPPPVPRDLRAWVSHGQQHAEQTVGQRSPRSTPNAVADPTQSSLGSSSYYYYYTTSTTASQDGRASVTSIFREDTRTSSSARYRRRFRTRHAAGSDMRLYLPPTPAHAVPSPTPHTRSSSASREARPAHVPPAPPPRERAASSGAIATPLRVGAHLPRYLLPDPDTASICTVRALLVDLVRVDLPAGPRDALPRLGCYYGIRALAAERRLAAPSTPRYTIEYSDQGRDVVTGQTGDVFTVHHLTELAAVAREPLTLFFVTGDDGANAESTTVWGLSTCEWGDALARPGVPQVYNLPLLRHNAILHGATVRVRLLALVRDVRSPDAPSPHPTAPDTAPSSLQSLEQQLMELDYARTAS